MKKPLMPLTSPKLPKSLTWGAALTTLPAWAHDGHGLFGGHWHATDVGGLVVVGTLVALALWMSRK